MEHTRDLPRRTVTAGSYVVLALYAFAVFGWELVVTLLLDPLWASAGPEGASLLHRSTTAAGWLLGAALIFRSARNPARGFDDPFSGGLRRNTPFRALGVGAAVALAIGIRAVVLQEWKLVGEYAQLADLHGDTAPFAFALLIVYYLCETALIVLVLALGQRAGEMRFGRPALPWGGLLLAITWGAIHILLQGPAAGIYAMAAAVLYGCVFAWGPRRPLPTFLIVAAAFIL